VKETFKNLLNFLMIKYSDSLIKFVEDFPFYPE